MKGRQGGWEEEKKGSYNANNLGTQEQSRPGGTPLKCDLRGSSPSQSLSSPPSPRSPPHTSQRFSKHLTK